MMMNEEETTAEASPTAETPTAESPAPAEAEQAPEEPPALAEETPAPAPQAETLNLDDIEATPALPHLTTEFFTWLWFASERDGGTMDLGEDVGIIDVWLESRLSFRAPDEDKARSVMTGENSASSLEARAALAGGKVVQDLQVHLRREDREYTVTLRGLNLDLSGLKLPAHAADSEDGVLYERLFFYEDVWFVIGRLYRRFAKERTSESWLTHTLPSIRSWVAGGPAEKNVPERVAEEELSD